MFPIPDKAEVTGEFVENWLEIKPDTPCIVVLNAVDDFVFKFVTANRKEKTFLLSSLNPAYKPYSLSASEILEIWKFKQLHLDEIPEPQTEMQELKLMMQELKTVMGKIKNG